MRGSHNAALLDSVVEKSEGGGGAVAAALLKAHFLENVRDGISDGGSGSEGEVDDTEGYAETPARFLCDELTHACNLERRSLDEIRDLGDILAFAVLCKCRAHYARARNADVDNGIRLTDTVERARHKGVVLGSVAEDNELRGADAVAVGGDLGGFLYDLAQTASMLMPALVEPMLTEEHTKSVSLSACGMLSISA